MEKTPLEDWIAYKIGIRPGSLSREAIEQYQLARIRQTVALAKEKSTFYREKLSGVNPIKIMDYVQFSKLPFTYPQDIKENPLRFVCVSPKDIDRIVTLQSSGTTGEPKRLFFTKEDQELTIDFFNHGMRNLVGPSDRVLILLPWQLPGSVGDLLRIGLKRLKACPLPYGIVQDPEAAIAAAVESGANAIVGIPTQVLGMARHRKGKELAGRIKSVLLSTDYVPQAICQVLKEQWGCKVFNHYGMTEMGLGGGVQCSDLLAYHLREADLYFEIVDPETGQLLPEGELGEIVFTTLTRQGMPLIRYRTGDVSRFIPENCPCGTILRSMEVVKQRISGKTILAETDFLITELDEVLFSINGILDYQSTLALTGGKDCLTIEVKTERKNKIDPVAMRQVLHTIPAIQQGLERGTLEVIVGESCEFMPISKGTAKRMILDTREQQQRPSGIQHS
ncbi:Phenylacetate-coenzyme A ligase [Sporomusa silvacetica DSM 10669]|uniref:Phenylacetate-coenzyme A ligase n=1 Tax=Sporomusa silvacetica DSM 10669 TaxID=1123289 RepID=A0ABZ3ILR6_9FIRM